MAIKGIMKDENWLEDPNLIKLVFFEHVSRRFSLVASSRMLCDAPIPNRLSPVDADFLDSMFSRDKTKWTVLGLW